MVEIFWEGLRFFGRGEILLGGVGNFSVGRGNF